MNTKHPSAHERYLFKPFPCSSHWWALTQLTTLPESARVLDIGPGSGAIGDFLKSERGISDLHAVEIDSETVQMLEAKGSYKEIVCSLESLSEKEFDCILLLDLLEHLPDPVAFLTKVAPLLKPGGCMLLSIPNVAHWSIRFSLLFGYFEYTNRGILDKTHLQFFNRRRFLHLCTTVPDCTLEHVSESLEPVEFILPAWLTSFFIFKQCRQLQLKFASLLPGFFAYQHLSCIRKAK